MGFHDVHFADRQTEVQKVKYMVSQKNQAYNLVSLTPKGFSLCF